MLEVKTACVRSSDGSPSRRPVAIVTGASKGIGLTSPDEVATLAVVLASDRTANVTGSNYVIDGGLLKTT